MNRRQALGALGKSLGLAVGAAIIPGLTLTEAARSTPAVPKSHQFDLILRGGQIVDGTGGFIFPGDVAVKGDTIAAVGHLPNDSASRVIDCTGLCICPGIINLHSHTFEQVFNHPGNDSAVLQGITTELGGVDGRSPLPLRTHLDRVEALGTGLNYAMLVGQGAVRSAVMGRSRSAAGNAEITAMQRLVSEAMNQGAYGMSNALEYLPDTYSSTAEIIALARVAGQYGGHYATHLRCEGPQMPEALEEAFRVGHEAALPVHISHLKVRGKPNWYLAPTIFSQIDRALRDGFPLTADIYPYLGAIYTTNLPLSQAWPRHPSEHLIVKLSHDPDHHGRSIAGLAQDYGISEEEMVRDILAHRSGALVAAEEMREEHLVQFLRRPCVIPSNDASARSWYEDDLRQRSLHPRTYGTFPRILGRYVRRLRALELEDAIHRFTGRAAALLGLKDRGAIRPGYYADLVAFNPDTVIDTSSWHAPQAQPAGIHHVFVNGSWAVRDGNLVEGARSGRVLRRI